MKTWAEAYKLDRLEQRIKKLRRERAKYWKFAGIQEGLFKCNWRFS